MYVILESIAPLAWVSDPFIQFIFLPCETVMLIVMSQIQLF